MVFNRIGNKLGLVGLVGVALSVGSVINYRMSQNSLSTVDEYRDTQQQISEQALVTAIGFRRVQLLAKDIRYAKNADDIAKNLALIPPSKTMYEKAVDTAINLSTDKDNKARFERTKVIAADYSRSVEELAKLVAAKFSAQGKSNAQSKDWNEKFGTLLESEALKENTNRLAIERELQEASAAFNAAATAGWRFAATGDPALKTAIANNAAKINELLARGSLLANDVTMRGAIDALGSTAKTFIASTNEIVGIEEGLTEITLKRALPAAAESSDLITAAIGVSRKAVAEAKEAAAAQLEKSNRINLALSIVVVLSILGSVLFGFWGVARPMTRLNRAMSRLAAGELNIVIPGADRGDEVGDIAKTIAVIRDNAEHKAAHEAEAKAEQDQMIAEQRKREMHQAGRRFRRRGRPHRADGVLGLDRARSLRRHADDDVAALAGIDQGGRRGVGGSHDQRAVGGVGDRTADFLGQRDQPSGAGIRADRRRSGRPGAQDQRPGRRAVAGRGAGSATWSN